MTNENAYNAIRLLDIVYDLYSEPSGYSFQSCPFTCNEGGGVTLNENLMTELNKEGNTDLVDWAHENIVSLFE